MEFLAGLIGVLIGGFVVLASSFLQGRQQMKQMEARFQHERQLAADDFQREKVAAENERLERELHDQLVWGERVHLAVGRTVVRCRDASTSEERKVIVDEVMAEVGAEPSGYNPLASLIEADILEDDDLRSLVGKHRKIIDDAWTELALHSHRNPSVLPDDILGFSNQVKDLKRRIQLRMRELKRQGKPL